MTIAATHRIASRRPDPARGAEDDLRHVRDLVFIRDLLRARGATPDELHECDAAIVAARAQLAESAKRASARFAAAA
jgi:hypothetical protein